MSMTTMAQLGAQSAHADSTDAQMEQIRELLVGDILRRADARVEALEARVRELEGDLSRRIEALAARIEALGAEQTTGRRSAFDELSRSVADLGERIRQLAQS
jgi:polyhydroxyalkanoate synthesis regulator phasin